MNTVFIKLINYSSSVFDKIRNAKPLYQILFILSFPVTILYLEFVKHVNSLSVFKSKKLENILAKYKMLKNFDFSVNLNDNVIYKDYYSLMKDSFLLNDDLISSLEAKFSISTTKEGIINYYKSLVLLNTCYFYTKNLDICSELSDNVIVEILDINKNISSDGNYIFFPSFTYEIFFYIKAKTNKELFNFIKNTDMYNNSFTNLENHFIFYKIRGRLEV